MFRNKDGQLSLYSFNCGYIQDLWKDEIKVELYQEGCFHVRCYDYNLNTRVFWYSFDSLVDARKAFFQCIGSTHGLTKKYALNRLQTVITGESNK